METNDIVNTLQERGNVYGDFDVGTESFAKILSALKDIHLNTHGYAMSDKDSIPVIYIIMKLVRLGSSPKHIDTWHDIQGYAKLTEDMYRSQNVTQN